MGAGTLPAPRLSIRVLATIAVGGGAITLIGSVLPWVSIFRGTQTLTAWDGAPRYLAGFALASAALTLLFVASGRPAALRRLAVFLGLIALAGIGFEGLQAVSLTSSRSTSMAILGPSLGPGPLVMAVGAALLIAVAAIPASGARVESGTWVRIIMAGALLTSGWIHLALTREHLQASSVLGGGFLIAALAQILLASLILVRPTDLAYYAAIGLSTGLIVVYAVAVFHGLPFGDGHDQVQGFKIGSGEPVDLNGVVGKLSELLTVAVAFALIGRRAGEVNATRC